MRFVHVCSQNNGAFTFPKIISHLHRRFPKAFTPVLVSSLSAAIAPPSRASISSLTAEQREKEDSARVLRQRPVLRICSELALVGVIRDGPERSGGEWVMKAVKDLVGLLVFLPLFLAHSNYQLSNDPSLSSLPLLITFLKSYSRPFLGIVPPAAHKQIPATTEPGTLSCIQSNDNDDASHFPPILKEEEELIERDIRDRFKRMCEGYFDNVCKKLVIEHKVALQLDYTCPQLIPRSSALARAR